MLENRRELTAHQRSALVTFHLGVLGKRLSTREIAQLTGVTERGALYLLHRISGTDVPLAFAHGQWYIISD